MQSLIGQKSTISLVQERPFDSLAARTRQRGATTLRELPSKYEEEFRGALKGVEQASPSLDTKTSSPKSPYSL